MSHHTQYRFCTFMNKEVPFRVQEYMMDKEPILYWHSCDESSQCSNTKCKWKSQNENLHPEDYTLK
jgi:hypothetical protein